MQCMIQKSDQPTSAHSHIATVLNGIVSGARRFVRNVRGKYQGPETPAEAQAYDAGFDAGIRSEFAAECPYVRKEQAKWWHIGFASGWAQAW